MNVHARLVSLPLAVGALLLGACSMTTFERAPLAATACDPALAGDWLSVADEPGEGGDIELRIGADCSLAVDEHEATGLRTGTSTPLTLGRHGDRTYAWFDATWLVTRFEEDHRPPAGDVYLTRYALDGDRLELWSTEEKAIAHAIIDGELKGEIISGDNRLFNRLVGEQSPDVLERKGFFDAEPVEFRRKDKDRP